MARFLDKTQDAQAVVRLVDQFQKTILIYQVCTGSRQGQARLTRVMKVSQQQAIHNQITQLTVGLFVFLFP